MRCEYAYAHEANRNHAFVHACRHSRAWTCFALPKTASLSTSSIKSWNPAANSQSHSQILNQFTYHRRTRERTSDEFLPAPLNPLFSFNITKSNKVEGERRLRLRRVQKKEKIHFPICANFSIVSVMGTVGTGTDR